MKNKIFIAIIILITICSCTKEDSNMRLEDPKLTPKERVIGTWSLWNKPEVWFMVISQNQLSFMNGASREIFGITDTALFVRNTPGNYPYYVPWNYSFSKNNDTLYLENFKLTRYER